MIKKLFVSLLLLETTLVALLLLVISCNQQKLDPGADETLPLITMEKTVCYGTCPVYQIRIYSNGMADYIGEMHVQKIGLYRKQLPAETISGLIRSFQDAGFWSLQDEYVAEITDLPTTYLSFQYQGKYKKVKDMIHAPQQLVDLENQIAAIADAPGWEKTVD